jgi:hypothetical protein
MKKHPYYGTQQQLDEALQSCQIILETLPRFNTGLTNVAVNVMCMARDIREIEQYLKNCEVQHDAFSEVK